MDSSHHWKFRYKNPEDKRDAPPIPVLPQSLRFEVANTGNDPVSLNNGPPQLKRYNFSTIYLILYCGTALPGIKKDGTWNPYAQPPPLSASMPLIHSIKDSTCRPATGLKKLGLTNSKPSSPHNSQKPGSPTAPPAPAVDKKNNTRK